MVRKRETHHQVRYGEVQNELVRDEGGEPPAERDCQDGEGVATHDEQHERPIQEAPGEVVVSPGCRRQKRRGRIRRLPRRGLIAECKVHNIAGRARQRPLGTGRRRGRLYTRILLTVTVARNTRFCRGRVNGMIPLTHFAHFPPLSRFRTEYL